MRTRFFLLAACLVAVILAAGGAVAASSTAPAVHACRKNTTGQMYLWGSCPKGYTAWTWNVTGPAGPQGRTGTAGATGPSGPPGPSFADPFTLTLGGTLGNPQWTAYTCSVSALNAGGGITGVVCLNPVSVVNRGARHR